MDGLAVAGGVAVVSVHGWAVVAPNAHLLDGSNRAVDFFGNLTDGTVVVESHQGGEIFRRDVGCGFHGDVGVGVGRVADNEDFNIAIGNFVQRRALYFENFAIGVQQVGALHALGTRARTNQEGNVGIFKGDCGVVCGEDVGKKWEGAILHFHDHAAQCLLCLRQVEQLQDNGLVASEHDAAGDTEEGGVGDLACRAGNGDSDGWLEGHIFPFEVVVLLNFWIIAALWGE